MRASPCACYFAPLPHPLFRACIEQNATAAAAADVVVVDAREAMMCAVCRDCWNLWMIRIYVSSWRAKHVATALHKQPIPPRHSSLQRTVHHASVDQKAVLRKAACFLGTHEPQPDHLQVLRFTKASRGSDVILSRSLPPPSFPPLITRCAC